NQMTGLLRRYFLRLLCRERDDDRRKAGYDGKSAGDKGQEGCHDERVDEEEYPEDQADGPQHPVASILCREPLVQVGNTDEAGPEPDEDDKEREHEDRAVEGIQEDE